MSCYCLQGEPTVLVTTFDWCIASRKCFWAKLSPVWTFLQAFHSLSEPLLQWTADLFVVFKYSRYCNMDAKFVIHRETSSSCNGNINCATSPETLCPACSLEWSQDLFSNSWNHFTAVTDLKWLYVIVTRRHFHCFWLYLKLCLFTTVPQIHFKLINDTLFVKVLIRRTESIYSNNCRLLKSIFLAILILTCSMASNLFDRPMYQRLIFPSYLMCCLRCFHIYARCNGNLYDFHIRYLQ